MFGRAARVKFVFRSPGRTIIMTFQSRFQRHLAFFVNIFRNFYAISDFSLALNSYGHEDNFQPRKMRKSSILLLKNEDEKSSVFR